MRRTKWFVALALTVVVGCSRPVAPLPEAALASPTPAPPVVFPRDAGPHDALTEWWYYTGHLRSDRDGHLYGFEFVVFQVERQDAPTGYLAHFAVSDVDGQRFSHQARFAQGQAAAGFPLDVNGWRLDRQASSDVIQASMQIGPGAEPPFRLDVRLTDDKPPALHHGGYIDYGPAGGSYYYSRTRLNVVGQLEVRPTSRSSAQDAVGRTSVTDLAKEGGRKPSTSTLSVPAAFLGQADGEDDPVSGMAWMDHQWGNFVVASAGGWDWYSLQLDDDTELMLYVLRSATGEPTGVYGSQVLADGSVRDLPPGSVLAESTGTWTSPHTGGVYPSGWLLSLPGGQRIDVRPLLDDQELWFPASSSAVGVGAMAYWEGAVSVTGDRTGVGYVELTGYAGH
jgi:predicted secreted hydrolase